MSKSIEKSVVSWADSKNTSKRKNYTEQNSLKDDNQGRE